MIGISGRTGLALGGGAVLGAAHIGLLRALEEWGVQVDYVAGTSAGALVGALYAFGLSSRDMEEITHDLNWFDISGLALSRYSLLTNKKMTKLIKRHLGEVNIEDARLPLAVVAADVGSAERVVLTRGSLSEALRASTAIPGVFEPVEIDGRLLLDGGVLENLPVTPLRDLGAEFIIASDLHTGRQYHRPRGIIELLLNVNEMVLSNMARLHNRNVDWLFAPDLTAFNPVDTGQTADLIATGYEQACRMLDRLRDEL
jgi:NTE family protein